MPATAGTPIVLEDGVEVTFDADPPGGTFHVSDYWVFAARTADASVEELVGRAAARHPPPLLPARGRHVPGTRRRLPDVLAARLRRRGRHDCGCDACVTPESHASGALTIQMAVDQVKGTGGKVCLQPGFYLLDEPVRIDRRARRCTLEGKGWRTILARRRASPAIVVERSLGVAIDSLTVLTATFARRAGARRRASRSACNTTSARSSSAASCSSSGRSSRRPSRRTTPAGRGTPRSPRTRARPSG